MTDTLTEVAQDLTAIAHLAFDLRWQAAAGSNDHEMPGGDALAYMAYVASPEAWQHQYEAREALELPVGHINDEREELPLQMLLFWSEQWRVLHGKESDRRPTIGSEVAFLREVLNWASEHSDQWPRFARHVHKVRVRLENTLHAGHRDHFSEDVVCLVCESTLRRRVTLLGYEDDWWCQRCHEHLTPSEYNLAKKAAAKRELGLV